MLLVSAALSGCSSIAPALTAPEVAGFAARLGQEIAVVDDAPTGPLDPDDAVQRALIHNHSVRAKELEARLAVAKARVLSGGLLPDVVAQSFSHRRDRPDLSRSSDASPYMTSSDLSTVTRDMTLSWNILDFGLSYVRARQGVRRANQQHEDIRRIRARVTEETRLTYWRAVALERLAPGLAELEPEVDRALALASRAGHDLGIDPTVSINQRRDILFLQRELNQVHASIASATEQLKMLTGLQGVERLRLVPLIQHPPKQPFSSARLDVKEALRRRPEIRQHMYDLQITGDEVEATILQLLPSATFSRALANDSNSHLLHNHWTSWSAKVAGNLVNLLRLDGQVDTVNQQGYVQRQSALATTAVIVMQVHVARARLAIELRAFRDAERFATVQRQLLQQVQAGVDAGKMGNLALTRERLSALLAEVRAVMAYAELQAASAAYDSAKGADPSASCWYTTALAPQYHAPARCGNWEPCHER